jgi:hypothetical protein
MKKKGQREDTDFEWGCGWGGGQWGEIVESEPLDSFLFYLIYLWCIMTKWELILLEINWVLGSNYVSFVCHVRTVVIG